MTPASLLFSGTRPGLPHALMLAAYAVALIASEQSDSKEMP